MRLNLIIFKIIFLISLNSLSIKAQNNNCTEKKHVVCYVASWSHYRTDKGQYKLSNIIPQYCTHFVYSFAGLGLDGKIEILHQNNDPPALKSFVKLKENNPCAKFFIAVGGWNEGSEKYSYMSETPERREIFADSVIRFLIYYGLDGLDLDWEYPTERAGIPSDKQNFVELLKLLKTKLSTRQKMLTIAIPASNYKLEKSYDIENICKNLDYVSLMAYNMNMKNQTSAHAPLKLEDGENRYTIDDAVQYIIKNGCLSNKIVLGITSAAKTFKLKYPNQNDIGAPVIGPGIGGKYLKSSGSLGFNEMCSKFNQSGWTHKYRKNNAVKISYKDAFWAVYDDEETVAEKGKYVLDNGLAGLMFWSIDRDDFVPECHKIKYPLLIAANAALKNNI